MFIEGDYLIFWIISLFNAILPLLVVLWQLIIIDIQIMVDLLKLWDHPHRFFIHFFELLLFSVGCPNILHFGFMPLWWLIINSILQKFEFLFHRTGHSITITVKLIYFFFCWYFTLFGRIYLLWLNKSDDCLKAASLIA